MTILGPTKLITWSTDAAPLYFLMNYYETFKTRRKKRKTLNKRVYYNGWKINQKIFIVHVLLFDTR